ncbi:pfkB family carbohydrate kinase [Peribacillus simplex]|uniref:PfkB family carbohydrate kinase n=1 Tax=Peribacillus simplex TaxID=1478 RepID=A0A9X8RDR3_9BACI|nr:PfkB family carbohydrate kinase [Peribacillus simplex]SIS02256.1 pfkB family carbohydrate kinase [Peribacillus simplex]
MLGIEFQDQYTVQEAAQIILNKGVKAVIVTLGEKGCCYINHEKCKMYSAYQVKVQDTTAAGDSFIGGFTAS